jgi:uncharacterized delta-60 repeat protein
MLALAVWFQAAGAAQAQIAHLYQLNNSFADDFGGPPLVPGGQSGAGVLNASQYVFQPNQGLSVSGALTNTGNYSLVIDLSFSSLTGYRKIVDFSNLTSDNGFYNLNAALNFYPVTSGLAGILQPDVLVRVVLTRDGATGLVSGYVNGLQQFTIDDSVNKRAVFTGPGGIIQFFNDDSPTSFREASGGVVDQIAIYNGVLTPAQAAALGGANGQARPGGAVAGFNPGAGADGAVLAIAPQPDGKAILGGVFSSYQGAPRNGIVRINADGSLDASFNPGVGADDAVNVLLLLDGGQVLVGGDFVTFNGAPRNGLARLNADGSLDASFDAALTPGGIRASSEIIRASSGFAARAAGVNAPGFVSSLKRDASGQIVVGGAFQRIADAVAQGVARLNPDGSPDASFKPGAGANGKVNASVIQPDGKPIIAGAFTAVDGVPRAGIARLKTNGKVDETFNPGAGVEGGAVKAIALQSDGAVVLGGDFSSVDGQARARIARVQASGAVDSGFNPGADGSVNAVSVDANGKTLLGGSFQKITDRVRNALARLNADGTVDASFEPGAGANGSVNALAQRADGSALIGGTFTAVDSSSRNRVALIGASRVEGVSKPVVSLRVNRTTISRAAGETARITFSRTGGDLSTELRVAYSVGGSAVAGRDYVALKGVKKLKAGKESASLQITPLVAGGNAKGAVKVTIQPGDDYTLGEFTSLKVKVNP